MLQACVELNDKFDKFQDYYNYTFLGESVLELTYPFNQVTIAHTSSAKLPGREEVDVQGSWSDHGNQE